MNIWRILFLLICANAKITISFLMKCPAYQLHFQKIIGFRPAEDISSSRSLIQHFTATFNQPANQECWKICQRDQQCSGYVLLLESNDCFGYTSLQKSDQYTTITEDVNLIADSNAIFFEKICLHVPENCKTKLWAITKIPGSSLVFQGKKTLSTLVTRRECAEKCIFESEFQCLSASFSPSYKNNYARLGNILKHDEVLGQCILSNKDKTTQPDAFRAAPVDEEYIENQCIDRPVENDSCSYELYSNSTFIYSELKYDGLTQKECQSNCSHAKRFYCQGVTFIWESGSTSECYLHSEDLISMGPRSILTKANSIYMRRVKCLNVSVLCNDEEMIIKYTPNDWFRGKLYVSLHSNECSVTGNGTNPTILRLPIGNEVKESRCGILRAYEAKESYQRTLISTLIVVQNNLNVQTQGDRLIKAGCILNSSNSSLSNNVPDEVALESSLAFTQTELPNEGSSLINVPRNLPRIHMQVVDLGKQFTTNDVQIGQNLELQIIAEPADAEYDVRAVSLVAKAYGQNSVTLIDSRGCPIDATIFPALKKTIENNKKILRAKFHAFKFAGTSVVNFDVKMHFCLKECTPVDCGNGVVSFGKRRKRDAEYSLSENPTNATSTVVQVKYPLAFTSFVESSSSSKTAKFPDNLAASTASAGVPNQTLEVPLNFKLNVHGPYLGEPNSLIYGENGQILISGVDLSKKDVVCIDQSLLIAIFIFWAIIQIIIMIGCYFIVRKYKRWVKDDDRRSLHRASESLDYTDESNRRVHWADQGSTLSFPG